MSDTLPVIDEAQLQDFGVRIFNLFQTHKTDRRAAEEHWLQNLRQFRGVYDPEVLSMIPKDCSKAYPKLTRWKCIGTVARLMQMLYPETERNWAVKPSPLPDLPAEQLQEVLNALVAEKAQETGTDPKDVLLDDIEIEKAISVYAAGKAERMSMKIDDDLTEMEFITLARRVVFSAVLYNVGVLAGPFHIKAKARKWQRDPNLGGYRAVEVDKYKPLFEFQPVWGWYPDMTATSLEKQDGYFIRHIMARWEVEALIKRPDFMGDRILRWLNGRTDGNYKPEWWESVIKGEPKAGSATVANKEGRKYEAGAYYGNVTGHELRAAGVVVKDEDIGKSFQANVWTLDNMIIKARVMPLGSEVRQHHVFMFEEDDLNILGNGQCDTLRDSQLAVCETARALLDNMSVVGPMVEVNTDLIAPGTDLAIRKHKTWPREGEGQAASMAAVRNINVESHITELVACLNTFMDFADKESGLPPPSLGDTSSGGSEALRTSKNASMFLGAAALPIRDTVRNYDTFTISVINALTKWNAKYDANPSRDGDFNIIGRGSTSLIAKEVMGQALNELSVSLAPEDMPYIKRRALLTAKMRAHDLPVDELLEDEATAAANVKRMQDAQSAMAASEARLKGAMADAAFAKALLNTAQARVADGTLPKETFDGILRMVEMENKQVVDEHKAETARIQAEKPVKAAA